MEAAEAAAPPGRGCWYSRAVSTATASSFLNCPGVRCGTGGRQRGRNGLSVYAARWWSHRAGTVRLGRRPRPAPVAGSMRRAIPRGCRRPGTPGRARPAAGGVRPAGRAAPLGGGQVLGPPGAGEFVHVGGDAVDDRPHPRQADDSAGRVRPVGGRAQVDHWRVAISVQVREPVRALLAASPPHRIAGRRYCPGRPARCPPRSLDLRGLASPLPAARRAPRPAHPGRRRPRAGAPETATGRPPSPECGSRSPRRGPRPAPTPVPVRPAPAATRHGRPASALAAPAGPPRPAR